jgi:GTP cyclohydrolase I
VSVSSLRVTERRVHVTAGPHGRDLDAAQAAAQAFLTALGIDLADEALAETPARMAKAYSELLTPRAFDLTTFPNDEGYEQLVLVQGIPFRSLCEHHALPFIGRADVGYLPGKRIIGLSKLARVVELFAHRAQVCLQSVVKRQAMPWVDPPVQRRRGDVGRRQPRRTGWTVTEALSRDGSRRVNVASPVGSQQRPAGPVSGETA